jgi:hypothetical protein
MTVEIMLLDLDRVFDNDRSCALAVPDPTSADLPADWREVYEERAAIREYDGGLPRELAEHYALLDTFALMRGDAHR